MGPRREGERAKKEKGSERMRLRKRTHEAAEAATQRQQSWDAEDERARNVRAKRRHEGGGEEAGKEVDGPVLATNTAVATPGEEGNGSSQDVDHSSQLGEEGQEGAGGAGGSQHAVEALDHECTRHPTCGGKLCLVDKVRCAFEGCSKVCPAKALAKHVNNEHVTADADAAVVRDRCGKMNLPVTPCLRVVTARGRPGNHACRDVQACARHTGSSMLLPKAAEAAEPCSAEGCVCGGHQPEVGPEGPTKLLCPVSTCASHKGGNLFGGPTALWQHVVKQHAGEPLAGLKWEEAGIVQCECGHLRVAGAPFLHACAVSNKVEGGEWRSAGAPLGVLAGVEWEDIPRTRRPVPTWSFTVRGTRKRALAIITELADRAATAPAGEERVEWWKLLFLFPQLVLRGPGKKSSAAVDEVHARIDAFLTNDPTKWQGLLDEWRSSHPPARPLANDEEAEFLRAGGRAHALLAQGDIAKAYQVVQSEAVYYDVRDEEDVAAIQQLFPGGGQGAGGTEPDEPAAEKVAEWTKKMPKGSEREVFDRALRKLRRGRAAGAAGWTAELLHEMTGTQTGTTALCRLVYQVINGLAPAGLYKVAVGGYVVPFDKGGGKVRPIVLQAILIKLAGKVAVEAAGDAIATALGSTQHGVGVKNGVEIVAHKARLARQEGHVLLQLDLSNAYNTAKRAAALAELAAARDKHPELSLISELAENAYGRGSLIMTGAYTEGARRKGAVYRVEVTEGFTQGDVISAFVFSLGLRPALEAAQQAGKETGEDGCVMGLVDDVTLTGTAGYVKAAFDAFVGKLHDTGGKLNHGKTVVHGKDVEDGGAAADVTAWLEGRGGVGLAPAQVVRVVGSHLGPLNQVREALGKRLEEDGRHADRLVRLARYDPQAARILADYCFTSRGQFLARVQTPEEMQAYVVEFDKHVERVADAIALGPPDPGGGGGTRLGADALAQACLPIRLGGLGLTRLEAVVDAAWVGAVAMVAGNLEATAPTLRAAATQGRYNAQLQKALQALKGHGLTDETLAGLMGEDQPQRTATRAVHKKRSEELAAKVSGPHRRRMASAASTTASLPHRVLPTRDFTFTAEEYHTMVQVRLGETGGRGVDVVGRCVCGRQVRGLDDVHFLSCKGRGAVTTFHNVIRDAVGMVCVEVHATHRKEHLLRDTFVGVEKDRRSDLEMLDREGKWRVFDVTTASVYVADEGKTAVETGEAGKARKYAKVNAANGGRKVEFLVMDSVGSVNRTLRRLLESEATRLDDEVVEGVVPKAVPTKARYLLAKVVCAGVRERARTLNLLRGLAEWPVASEGLDLLQ